MNTGRRYVLILQREGTLILRHSKQHHPQHICMCSSRSHPYRVSQEQRRGDQMAMCTYRELHYSRGHCAWGTHCFIVRVNGLRFVPERDIISFLKVALCKHTLRLGKVWPGPWFLDTPSKHVWGCSELMVDDLNRDGVRGLLKMCIILKKAIIFCCIL